MTIDRQCLDCAKLTAGCWRHSIQVDLLPQQSMMPLRVDDKSGLVLVKIGDEDVDRKAWLDIIQAGAR